MDAAVSELKAVRLVETQLLQFQVCLLSYVRKIE